jgi:hypothetical protein
MKAPHMVAILLLALSGCDKPSELPPPAREDRLYDDQRNALERAQDLEQQMRQDADRRQREIEEAAQ